MFAPWVGMGLAFLIYFRGLGVANALLRIAPLKWIHTWLYRRMYFDELYWFIFVWPIKALASLGALFDRKVIDGLVDGVAGGTRTLSVLAGLHDKYIVDGAVNGVANATQGIGAAVRNPGSGRIRLYITLLFGIIVVGLAVAIVVALSLAA